MNAIAAGWSFANVLVPLHGALERSMLTGTIQTIGEMAALQDLLDALDPAVRTNYKTPPS